MIFADLKTEFHIDVIVGGQADVRDQSVDSTLIEELEHISDFDPSIWMCGDSLTLTGKEVFVKIAVEHCTFSEGGVDVGSYLPDYMHVTCR